MKLTASKLTHTLPLVVFLLTPALSQQKDWQALAASDPILRAMRAELERSKSQLKLDQVAAPYYIEYRVFDVDDFSAEASFGSLRSSVHARGRVLRVVVRIGDYKQDSYFGRGEGALNLLGLDDDIPAFRHALWLATDNAYKQAAEALAEKQAQLKQFTIDEPTDDFAHAEPVQSIGPTVKLELETSAWTRMLEDATALFRDDLQIEAFGSALNFQATNRYYVNSEGTILRSGRSAYEMSISCTTQAADGMYLQRNNGFVETTLAKMPSSQVFVGRARELAASLKALREAPIVEESYRGPVLLSADAAATVFADLVGQNVLGLKPALGKSGRTATTFATSYKNRVLPDFISVDDDPTNVSYQGKTLVGNYEFDDEGVPARKVPLIENGVLTNFLLGRQPIRDFPVSNGHGRARIPSNGPGPSLGNLIIRSNQAASPEELKAKFLNLCKQRDLPYCYRVETFGPKLVPRLLYKVWVKDGHEELVRGAVFGDLDTRALRSDLVAVGSDVYIESRLLNIPHSIASPSVLFDELEVKRAGLNKEKLPDYPPPPPGR